MLKLAVPSVGEAEVAAAAAVLRSGNLVYGARGQAFEEALSGYLGVEHCAVVSSGTAALHLALLALGVGPGDAVAVPDFTFPATANAVAMTGAVPVLVDITRDRYCMDPRELARLCEGWAGPQRLRAVIPVHEFGCPADMDLIGAVASAHGLRVVEDAACALGATVGGHLVGTIGDVGCFSFHPRKILTTGEGGAVVSRDPELAERLRTLRNHGIQRTAEGLDFVTPGLNYRLTDIQAAIGLEQLKDYHRRLERRSQLKDAYFEALADLPEVALPADIDGHIWQTFLVLLPPEAPRASVMEHLGRGGIETSVGAQSLRHQSAFRGAMTWPPAAAWVSTEVAGRGLALPFCESYGQQEAEQVSAALREALAEVMQG